MHLRTTRITTFAAATLLAAAFAGAGSVPASAAASRTASPQGVSPGPWTASENGYGPTQAAAWQDGVARVGRDFAEFSCYPPFFQLGSGQLADGSWWVRVGEHCPGGNPV